MQAASHLLSNNQILLMLLACISLNLTSPLMGNAVAMNDGRGSAYSFKSQDNICGLTEARQLSRPARVNYDDLLESTPEVKRMRKKQIAPSSAQGIRLLELARARIQKACREEMGAIGYCSVWKRITRRDGTKIPNLTQAVRRRIALG